MPSARVHVDRPLTDLTLAFPPDIQGIRSRYFPRKPVKHLSDQIFHWSKANDLRLDDLTPVGTDDHVPEVFVKLDAESEYLCKGFGAQAPADEITIVNADPGLNFNQRRALAARRRLELRLEYEAVKNTLRDATKLAGLTLPAARRFDNYASGDSQPIIEMMLVCDSVELQCGHRPNRIDMTRQVWTQIQNHPDSIDRVKANGMNGLLTRKYLEEVLDVPAGTINITTAQYNAAANGATASYKTFLGADILFAYVEPPSLENYGLGFEFSFNGFSSDPIAIVNVFDPMRGLVGTDYQKAIAIVDFKITVSEAGYALRGAVNTADSRYKGYLD